MKALLVSGREQVCRAVVAALERRAHAANVLSDPAAAAVLLAAEQHPLVVVDADSFGDQAAGLCRRLRAVAAARPAWILVLVGSGWTERCLDLLAAGADDLLVGPPEPLQLEARFAVAERRAADGNLRSGSGWEEELKKEQESLRQLLELAERDRELVAFEIHDGFAQLLAGAQWHFESAARLYPLDPDQGRQAFEKGCRLLGESIQESRRLISGLRPPVLDAFGVVPAIENLILEGRRAGGPQVELAAEVKFERLARPLENAIFRIVQESLTNAARHSRSEKVRVELTDDGQMVHLSVRDSGVGFDPDQVPDGHFGLRGIRERARLLGGRAAVESRPGQGTTIRVELPLLSRPPDAAPDL